MRTIQGQETLVPRTTHEIGVDTLHDEIVVPNPFAEAILVFRGGAKGEERPIRILQGPKTQLGYTDNVAVDPIHNEIYVVEFRTDSILVFPREANGDVAPIRIIHGPKTRLDRPMRISVDPVNNLMAVTSIAGLLLFNRTDNGDVAPRTVIAGPKTGLGGEGSLIYKAVLNPKSKKIIVAGGTRASTPGGTRGAFLGIWNYGDYGDVPPWAILRGNATTKLRGTNGGLDVNPDAQEVLVLSGGGMLVYHLPEFF